MVSGPTETTEVSLYDSSDLTYEPPELLPTETVRIQLDRATALHVAEFRVFDHTGTNVAATGSITQSSEYGTIYPATKAVDGDIRTFSHTLVRHGAGLHVIAECCALACRAPTENGLRSNSVRWSLSRRLRLSTVRTAAKAGSSLRVCSSLDLEVGGFLLVSLPSLIALPARSRYEGINTVSFDVMFDGAPCLSHVEHVYPYDMTGESSDPT